ncbi:hypothetical protein Rsub_10267 [Raphidocelis subcapitata]|uniref:Uncharacterized protein n=1 Tax=Raphidocelis subcapitata TaxID=307507 RepID=A0A2V0PEU4_9CHLO|nr:hypothetical protein Rsub_10267 [Raphidocelis subcapitata]|eukprot:GBF98039.1 hypothetical protein Rsub_10267 [Raphidocelis subcapitata]
MARDGTFGSEARLDGKGAMPGGFLEAVLATCGLPEALAGEVHDQIGAALDGALETLPSGTRPFLEEALHGNYSTGSPVPQSVGRVMAAWAGVHITVHPASGAKLPRVWLCGQQGADGIHLVEE